VAVTVIGETGHPDGAFLENEEAADFSAASSAWPELATRLTDNVNAR
jgi:hypothetical protein